jgi:hypothetical protein
VNISTGSCQDNLGIMEKNGRAEINSPITREKTRDLRADPILWG